MIDIDLIIKSMPYLLDGCKLTIFISLLAFAIGLFFGCILGFILISDSKFLKCMASLYISLIRGTPMLLHILIIFYVFPQIGISFSPITSVIIAIGLNSSAYISQIIKSGIISIPKGQTDASKAIGFNWWQTNFYVIFPQVFRVSLPSLGNEVITLVKDSSLASVIGIVEITKQASIIKSQSYDALTILFATSILYLIITSLLAFINKKLENKVNQCYQ